MKWEFLGLAVVTSLLAGYLLLDSLTSPGEPAIYSPHDGQCVPYSPDCEIGPPPEPPVMIGIFPLQDEAD